MTVPTHMTFFSRFENDILSGKKTITIRDESEKNYQVGSRVTVATFEDGREFCQLDVLAVEPIHWDDLNVWHAEQENMTLSELKSVISEIYPNETQFYVVSYQLVSE